MSKTDLHLSDSEYRDLVEQASELIQCVDQNGKFIYVNKTWIEALGYGEEEIIKLSFWDIIHPESIEDCRKVFAEVLSGKPVDFVEAIFLSKSGESLAVEGSIGVRKDASDNIISTQGIFRDVTTYRQFQKDLKQEQNRYHSFISVSNTCGWEHHQSRHFLWCSPEFFTMLGYQPGDFDSPSGNMIEIWRGLVYPEDLERAVAAFRNYLSHGKDEMFESHFRMVRKNGEIIWVWSRGRTLRDENGNLGDITVGTHIDISKRIQMENLLAFEKERYRTTLLSVGDAVISTDNHGKVKLMNPVAEVLTGWTQREAVDKKIDEVFRVYDERDASVFDNSVKRALNQGQVIKSDDHTLLKTKTGEIIPIKGSAAPIKDADGNTTGVVIVFRDFTETRKQQKEIEYLSFHDFLTGLYNRRYIEDAVNRMDTKRNLPFAIMTLDVNGLKLTNDAFGHKTGDCLLKAVSEILISVCRADDIIGRVGGDEFMVLLPRTNASQAVHIQKRIEKSSSSKKLGEVMVSLAIGYAVKEKLDEDIQNTIRASENNMYKNKLKTGKVMRNQTIEMVIRSINQKFKSEALHTKRVVQYCDELSEILNLSEQQREEIKIAAMLHDIGKIIIPPEMLNKQEQLTEEELELVKKHAETSYQILRSVDEYGMIAELTLYHHERWDGSGYPEGLKGEEIPLGSRIIAVADAYEAMTTEKNYRQALSPQEAIAELQKHAGSQFDPLVVKALTKIVK
ncbi:MAG: PAS domain S-box protein [Tissierellales bacterium]|nr:PAS domain S-box protein [Tissierellales bacterium]MBN2827485.1 PAS domain S-box protein [Tissierellales bacterium]